MYLSCFMRCSTEPYLARNRCTLQQEVNAAYESVLDILNIDQLNTTHPLARLLPLQPIDITDGTLDEVYSDVDRKVKFPISNLVHDQLRDRFIDEAMIEDNPNMTICDRIRLLSLVPSRQLIGSLAYPDHRIKSMDFLAWSRTHLCLSHWHF